jgi:hypothetical protein
LGDDWNCGNNDLPMRSHLLCVSLILAGCGPSARDDIQDAGPSSCDPSASSGLTCSGNSVVHCNDDGTLGGLVDVCGAGTTCLGGACVTGNGCATGVEDVFVVDTDNNLLRFDPTLVGTGSSPFSLIGRLNCPTTRPDLRLGGGTASPFSMSVARDGTAWILYSSGEIMAASTLDASCTGTGYAPSQSGMDLFGMGFATDAAGGDSETLYVAGGSVEATPGGDFARIDTVTRQLTVLGSVTSNAESSPELSGTGNGELFSFFPGFSRAFVQEINKANGSPMGSEWTVAGGLGGDVLAFAFAHWGGRFYLFVTISEFFGDPNSQVQMIDRNTGQHQVLMQNLGSIIVGAGVSTCAPVEIE